MRRRRCPAHALGAPDPRGPLRGILFGCVYACTTVQSPLLVRSVFGERGYTAIYSRVSIAGSLCSAIAAVFWAWVSELPGGYVLMFGLSIVAMVTCLFLGFSALG